MARSGSFFLMPRIELVINYDIQPIQDYSSVPYPLTIDHAIKHEEGNSISKLTEEIKNHELSIEQLQSIYVALWNNRQEWARTISGPYSLALTFILILPQSKLLPILTEDGPVLNHITHLFYDAKYTNFARSDFIKIFDKLPQDEKVYSSFVNGYKEIPTEAISPLWKDNNEPVQEIYDKYLIYTNLHTNRCVIF